MRTRAEARSATGTSCSDSGVPPVHLPPGPLHCPALGRCAVGRTCLPFGWSVQDAAAAPVTCVLAPLLLGCGIDIAATACTRNRQPKRLALRCAAGSAGAPTRRHGRGYLWGLIPSAHSAVGGRASLARRSYSLRGRARGLRPTARAHYSTAPAAELLLLEWAVSRSWLQSLRSERRSSTGPNQTDRADGIESRSHSAMRCGACGGATRNGTLRAAPERTNE